MLYCRPFTKQTNPENTNLKVIGITQACLVTRSKEMLMAQEVTKLQLPATAVLRREAAGAGGGEGGKTARCFAHALSIRAVGFDTLHAKG